MIKVYDSSIEQYVTVASNRGDKLYTKSINFQSPELPNYDDDSSIITLDEALTSISDEIKSVKEGIAWVYKNGTIGGGGGGGTSQNASFNIEVNNNKVDNNNFVTTSGSDITIGFSIKGLPNGRKITLSITQDGNYLEKYKNVSFTVSSKMTYINLKNITKDTYISFSGYDNETFAVIESYSLNIKIAELFINGNENISFDYNLNSKIVSYEITSTSGVETRTRFKLYIYKPESSKPLVYSYIPSYFTSSKKTISFDIFDKNLFINEDNEYLNLSQILLEYDNDTSKIIDSIKIEAFAETNQFTNLKPFTTYISIVYHDRVSIDMFPFTSLSNNEPEELYNENKDMLFTISLRYAEDTDFYMYYELYQIINDVKYNIYQSSEYPNIPTVNRPNDTAYFSRTNTISINYDTLVSNGLDISLPVYIQVISWDLNYNTAPDNSIRKEGAKKTKYFKFRTSSEDSWKPYNISFSGIDNYEEQEYGIYAYWNQKDIPPTTNKKTWSATLVNKKIDKINWDYKKYIEYYNCNDSNNGLIKSSNDVNKLRLSSKGYATIKNNDGTYFTPFGKIFNQNYENNWFLGNDCKQENWTISLLYKSDIQANDNAVILDYSIKDNDNNIKEGIFITTKNVIIKFRSAGGDTNKIVYNIEKKLTQNIINQIDIVFEGVNDNKSAASLKLYINGVMQSASVNDKSYFTYDYLPTQLYDEDRKENIPIIFGAKRKKNGGFEDFCDFDIYRLIFYKKALTKYHILKNYIQGNYEVYRNSNGEQDIEENNKLREKNFFNNNGTCSLCVNNPDDFVSYYTFKSNQKLYEDLLLENVLPVVHINVIEDSSTFYNIERLRWAEGQVAADKNKNEAEKTITKKYRCEISITSNGKTISIGDSEDKRAYKTHPSISLQGTSTLGFVSKNYQISCGTDNTVDDKGNHKEYLIQPFEEMLPENEWILKADIVDSGHANNAAIGGFINDFLSDYCQRSGVDDNGNNKYSSELKHTTVGQPCIVFMSYNGAFNDGEVIPNYMYKGIYSFNLGRISYFNLGYKVFDGYYKTYTNSTNPELVDVKYENHKVITDNISFPLIVEKYDIIDVPYINKNVDNGNTSPVVCFECVENNNTVGSFQQYGKEFIEKFYDRVYPNNATGGFGEDSFLKIFKITSALPLCDPNNDLTSIKEENKNSYKTRHSYIRNVDGEFKIKNENRYEDFNINNINSYEQYESIDSVIGFYDLLTTPQSDDNNLYAGLNWEYASTYFVLACLFGLVDSLGKNLNIRSFDQKTWYTSFYDMDTGLGINNEGQEIVKNDIYLDKFTNLKNNTGVDVYQNSYSNGGFNTCNSRLWNIIRNLKTVAYTENKQGFYGNNYRSMWDKIRTTLLINPDTFITDYYMKHNNNVGQIIFNLDYDVKYVNDAISKLSGNDINNEASEEQKNKLTSSLSLLHGDRINFIKDWFPKHVYFLDGVFDFGCQDQTNSNTSKVLYGEKEAMNFCYGYSSENTKITPYSDINTPYRLSEDFARTNSTGESKTFYIKANAPTFLILNNSSIVYNRYYLPENELVPITFRLASNSNGQFYMNGMKNITNLNIIKDFNFTSIKNPNFMLLVSFDISNSNKINVNKDEDFDISNLINLIELKMSNVKNAQQFPLKVDLSNSPKVNYIDISNSDVDRLPLYEQSLNNKGGVIEYLNVSNTYITELDLTNQSLLTYFNASGCKKMDKIILEGCEKLTNVNTIPTSVKELNFNKCNSLEELNLSNMEKLKNENFILGELKNLKKFTYTYNENNKLDDKGKLTSIDLSGCPNLEEINLPNFAGDYITLNVKSKKTLKSINLSNSNVNYIIWYDEETKQKIYAKINDSYKGILDFRGCTVLNTILLSNNKNIEYVLLNEKKTIENIDISYCDELKRITGNIKVDVNKFSNLSKFRFNELCKYDEDDDTSIIILDSDGEVSLADVEKDKDGNAIFNEDDDENGNHFINYELNKLLTHYTFKSDNKITLDNCFNNTGINISDLYAILLKLKNWKSDVYKSEDNPEGYITAFNSTFANCTNIKTFEVTVKASGGGKISDVSNNSNYKVERQYIKEDLFAGFDNLQELKNTFEGCANIKGTINKIFNPLSSLTVVKNVFNSCGELYIDDSIFASNTNLTHIIKPFSDYTKGIVYKQTGYPNIGEMRYNNGDYLNLSNLFKNNGKLEEITDIFSNTLILFNNYNMEDLFKNNKNLKKIYKFFPNHYVARTSEINEIDLSNVFGGKYRYMINNGEENEVISKFGSIEKFNSSYPRHLEDLQYAFATDGSNENQPMLKWKDLDKIFYNLEIISIDEKNQRYTTSLKNCAYMFDNLAYLKDNDDYYDYGENNDAKFPLDLFNIKDENGNDIEFANLESCEGLFKRAAFKDTLYFPGNIFKNCTYNKGLNLSHLLEDTYMTPIVLVNENDVDENGNNYICFNNCYLGDISSMFKNCFKGVNKKDFDPDTYTYIDKDGKEVKSTAYKLDRGGLHGIIPYKFFKNKSFIKNMESVFEGCCHLGAKYDASGNFAQRDESCFYNIRKPEPDTIEEIINNKDYSKLLDLVEQDIDGNWIWNAWSYDGTIFDDGYLNALNKITLNGKTYTEAKRENIINYIDLIWTDKENIPSDDVLSNLKSGKCLFDNDNQKNSLLVASYKGEYLGEVQLDKNTKEHIYRVYYDADYDIKNVNFDKTYFEGSKYQLWNCDSYTYINDNSNSEVYKHNKNENHPTLFIRNYLCPMDLFRYSSNNCLVNKLFKNVSRFNNDDKINKYDGYVYGLIGRIPPKLFYPLSNTTSLENVFENNKGIIPYAQSLDGLLYNFTFGNNKELNSISGLFRNSMILGNLSNNLFENNAKIKNISELFKNGYMPNRYASYDLNYEDYRNFVNRKLFSNNSGIENAFATFGRDNNQNDYNSKDAFLYFDIDDNLFNTEKHYNLENVGNLFSYQTGIQRNNDNRDEIIHFEYPEWNRITNKQNCYIGANFNMELIPKEMGGVGEDK